MSQGDRRQPKHAAPTELRAFLASVTIHMSLLRSCRSLACPSFPSSVKYPSEPNPDLGESVAIADARTAAPAKEKKAELVTGEAEFKAVEKEIKINWLA